MRKRKTARPRPPKDPQEIADASAARGVPEEELQGPPARETVVMQDNATREAEAEVATPDQNVVDDIGDALGVPRAPDEEFRTSQEILEGRDRYRAEAEEEE